MECRPVKGVRRRAEGGPTFPVPACALFQGARGETAHHTVISGAT